MSFFNLFSGPTPEKLEHKGDTLFDAGLWGQAKQAYERAVHKLEKNGEKGTNIYGRILEKIGLTRETLAKEHQQNAQNYLDGGYIDEAKELLLTAFEVSMDHEFKKELKQQFQEIEDQQRLSVRQTSSEEFFYGLDDDAYENNDYNEQIFAQISEDEEFLALCNTLPREVSDAYQGYGQHFKTGYVALNQGDFPTAVISLEKAMQENPQPASYIALELATAYWNLDRPDEAQAMLEDFITYHPDALPAYRLLCEIYWEQKDFSRAESLLASIPEELIQSLAVVLLKGETFFQSKNYEEAKSFYESFLATYGWHDPVARELAKTCEALGESNKALNIYKTIISNCTACSTKVDLGIKDRYAELSFATGIRNTDILELYLSLARENPEDAPRYFDRISRIYTAQDNLHEAARFRSFSDRAKKEKGEA